MKREEIKYKLSGIKRGDKIRITPMSTRNGDPFTTLAIPGFGPAKEHIEIHEPFFARLDSFDGETLWITSEKHSTLRLAYDDLKEVSVLLQNSYRSANTIVL